MGQYDYVKHAVAEEEARREADRDDVQAKKRRAFDKAYPEESDARLLLTLIAIAVFALVIAWGHYGPLVRDAIYGAS